MSLATAKDVELSLRRPLTADETAFVFDLLDRAERMIASRVPIPPSGSEDPMIQMAAKTIADVEAEAVARVFRMEPDAIHLSESEGNYSYRVNLQVASGLLDVLDSEWQRLGASSWGIVSTNQTHSGSHPTTPPWDFQYVFGSPATNSLRVWTQ